MMNETTATLPPYHRSLRHITLTVADARTTSVLPDIRIESVVNKYGDGAYVRMFVGSTQMPESIGCPPTAADIADSMDRLQLEIMRQLAEKLGPQRLR